MKYSSKNLVLSGLFLALGLLLPFLTAQMPGIGNKLLPMHIPVLICGYVCGKHYGMAVGFIVPVLRSFLFGMPVMFPMAVSMSFELAAYGFLTGLLYQYLPGNKLKIYLSLIISMICGRIIWGIASVLLFGVNGAAFTFEMFIAGAFINAIPGIIIQIILIPAIILSLQRSGVIENAVRCR